MDDLTPVERALTAAEWPLMGLTVVGAWAAVVSEWRAGAFVVVGAVVAGIGARVVRGVVSYRRVMSRPWPAVRPLPDDDW